MRVVEFNVVCDCEPSPDTKRSDTYYDGFIYQNPKYVEGTEKEVGDVILWVRDWPIFEIV